MPYIWISLLICVLRLTTLWQQTPRTAFLRILGLRQFGHLSHLHAGFPNFQDSQEGGSGDMLELLRRVTSLRLAPDRALLANAPNHFHGNPGNSEIQSSR